MQKGSAVIAISQDDGGSSTVQVCNQGQRLCPAAAFLGRPLPCRAVASTDMVMTAVPKRSVLKAFDGLGPQSRDMLQQMASNLCQSHVEHSLASTSVKNRLAKLLHRLHLQFLGAELPFTEQDLAEMSGTRQETVSRTLMPWRCNGVIQSGIGRLRVIQSGPLQKMQD